VTPDDPIAGLARRINADGSRKAVVYVAGGGTEVFPMLLAWGGGSATLLSGRIPYDAGDFRAILGRDPGRLVDARAARGLAMAAFRHALALRGDLPAGSVFGLGATSKLGRGDGERERAGRSHEIHAALQASDSTFCRSITLAPGRDRAAEERINALVLLQLLARGKRLNADLLPGPDAVVDQAADVATCRHPEIPALLEGRRAWLAFDLRGGGDFGPAADGETPRLILPGSFRPLHDGHVRMAAVASELTGLACDYELSLFHPEKPPLDYLALESRLRGLAAARGRLVATNAPTYVEKARLFPGCTFVVGHDTALRILDPRFYGGATARDAMLAELEALGTRLLVFGRVDADGQFRDFEREEFDQPAVAAFLARNARPVPEDRFRVDLSSTQVRARDGDDFP